MNGLSDEEVRISINKYGTNKLEKKKTSSFIKLFIESLSDPIIKILLIALGIKVIFLIKSFDWYETIGIVIAIFMASFISTISEYGSEKAFIKLQEEASKIKCKTKRNNKLCLINIEDVVVGDIISLSSGDIIPADGIIISDEVNVNESSINGESKEKNKKTNDKVYRGTIVTSGIAFMRVNSVGINTYYGKIADEIQEKSPETPLKLRLKSLAKTISIIGYIGAFLVFISYLFSVIVIDNNFDLNLIKEAILNTRVLIGYILYAFTLAVTIIVVAVPEGLPMMITLVLSSNMKKMLKDNVLVRKMMGIETSGNINILFTDKTGTLTYGNLKVVRFITSNLKPYDNEDELKNTKYYDLVKKSFILNNESVKNNNKIIGGNTTDRALMNFFKDCNLENNIKERIPFSSTNKYSKVVLNDNIVLIKGAYEKILPMCNYYYDENLNRKYLINKNKIIDYIKDASKKSMRIITFAIGNNNIYTLLGFCYLKDEIRLDAKEGLKLVNDAGISTIMLTGDAYETAFSIANELGMIRENDIAITSDELNKMTSDEIKQILPRLRIVARSMPVDKTKLVKIAQEMGYVVGMTGDGINDASALKNADVGFSLGSGTEIAKEASDIVLLDDNFNSITNAILYGRTIFKSIRKFIILQLTSNICAMSLSIIGPFIGVNTPVTVVQMLWINMVMDTLAGLAFSYEPALKSYMKEKPLKKDEPIINKYMLNEIIFTGTYSSILCLLFLKLPIFFNIYRKSGNNKYFLTGFFALLIFVDVFNTFNARVNRINILSNIRKNKVFILIILFIVFMQLIMIYYGGDIFRTSGLTIKELLITIFIASTVIPVDIIRKIILKLQNKNTGV